MHKRVLITGGAGFVGSTLAITLKQNHAGLEVTALDNLHRRGSELNLSRLRCAGVQFEHGDIRCPGDLRALKQAPELIIECSAEPSAQAGYGGSPEFLIQTNLNGCYNCLELARETKADLIFISTSRVYPVKKLNSLAFEEGATRFILSDRQTVPGSSREGISENFPLDGARSLYGMTKLAAELMVTEYADAYGLRCVINRCGLIAGPWQMGKTDQGVISLWMAAHYFRRPLQYIGFGGTGKQVRDILHVDDLSVLIQDQMQNISKYAGGLFNAGGGLSGSLSLREMTGLCEKITGNRIDIHSSGEERPADVRIYLTDNRNLTQFRGWRPRRSPEDVLTDIYQWIKREEEFLKPILAPG
ncbi:MAG: NAD-dependent epimerase/dehydratase family protein [Bryobacteraceae bacterium]